MNGYGDLGNSEGIIYIFLRFIIPLYLAHLIHLLFAEKKKSWGILLVASTVLYVALSLTFSFYKLEINVSWFRTIFFTIFVFSLIVLFLPSNMNIRRTLFFGISGYAIQNFADNLFFAIKSIFKINFDNRYYDLLMFIAVYVIVYSLYLLLFLKKLSKESLKNMDNKVVIRTSLFALLVVNVLSMYSQSCNDRTGLIATNLYAIIACILLLAIQYNTFSIGKLKNDKVVLESLLDKENEHLRLSKANNELINIKCHDIKHQIEALKDDISDEDKKCMLDDLKKEISFYDESIKSGNATLDTLLMEKYFYCKKHHIKFSAIIDGSKLDFIDNIDVYSLFGNAIDNAINSVLKATYDKRVITLNVKIVNDAKVVIHMENYCNEKIEFLNDLPQTKKNQEVHGFGTKSIKYICEKYGGKVTFRVADNKFLLNAVIPLRKEKKNEN